MKVAGEYWFAARREAVWTALLDPAILARTLPGCEALERTADHRYRGVLNVAIGPVKGQFQGTLVLSDLRPLEGYRMELDGSGPAGFMRGAGEVRLREDGDRTLLVYDLDAQVGGRVAGVGQRLLDSSAKSIAKQGLEGLERVLDSLQTTETTLGEAAAPLPEAPSQAGFAARVARDVAADLVPRERRPWLIAAVVVVVVAAVALVLRSCGG
jgi:carbon monoxide dehydrogenase subunit G